MLIVNIILFAAVVLYLIGLMVATVLGAEDAWNMWQADALQGMRPSTIVALIATGAICWPILVVVDARSRGQMLRALRWWWNNEPL